MRTCIWELTAMSSSTDGTTMAMTLSSMKHTRNLKNYFCTNVVCNLYFPSQLFQNEEVNIAGYAKIEWDRGQSQLKLANEASSAMVI